MAEFKLRQKHTVALQEFLGIVSPALCDIINIGLLHGSARRPESACVKFHLN